MTVLASLLLADSRLPTGGHAHSGGVEAAAERGLIRDETSLALFLAGRLRGSGLMIAAAAAAGCLLAVAGPVTWASWDTAVSARIPSAAAREASRAQGMTLLRTARRVWPSAALDELSQIGPPHHPLVLGAAVAAAGDDADAAAALALHHLLGGACAAAIRLLGLDPIAVAAVQARSCTDAQRIVVAGLGQAHKAFAQRDPRLLPSTGTPLPELLAELHAAKKVTLFAS
ncbi:MAG TPA: urease accessory UreF family protein [Pseudonocardiaceae bacterium]|nr:urease accessory UreF family protein [Pseudonocardiaceae bacterium]